MAPKDGFSSTAKFFLSLIDVIIFNISIFLSFYIRYQGNIPQYNFQSYIDSLIYITIFFVVTNILFGVYIFYNKSLVDLLTLTIISQMIMTFTIMAISFFGRWFTFPRSVLMLSLVLSIIFLYLWRYIAFKLYLKISGTKRVLLIGRMEECEEALFNFTGAKNDRYDVYGIVSERYLENLEKHISEIDVVYLVSKLEEKEKNGIYDLIIQENKQFFVNTNIENLLLVNPSIINIEDESIIRVSPFHISPENILIKRTIDLVIATILFVVTLPISLLAAILVKITSPGPVLYKQVRITKNGNEFNILKFRTMSATAEQDTGPVLATTNDPRITPIGKIFRSTRIDELPQLINVIKGEMSLVGPRPERPFFVDEFTNQNKYYPLRHNVRAGITGYAQVYGKYASNFNSKLKFDLLYIKNYSVLLDIKILLQTVKILFDKVSSQGLEETGTKNIPENIKIIK